MKVLSLWQPWASLIAWRVKTIETRSWKSAYRGEVAIHASARTPRRAAELALATPAIAAALERQAVRFEALPKSAIIAVCNLRGCPEITPSTNYPAYLEQHPFGDFTVGRFGWILTEIRPLKFPLENVKGAQGLQPAARELEDLIRAQLDDPTPPQPNGSFRWPSQ